MTLGLRSGARALGEHGHGEIEPETSPETEAPQTECTESPALNHLR